MTAMARCAHCGVISKDEALACEMGDCQITDWSVRSLPCQGFLHLDGWAGRSRQRVEVIAETPKRYRVRALEGHELRLPRRGQGQLTVYWPGTYLVPKASVTFAEIER